ncbi:MAG: diacylglycerol/lipid kinase family protein [Spirochaetaceae bacterium]
MAGLESALLLINPTRNPGQLKLLRRAARRFSVAKVVETEDLPHFVAEVERFARGEEQHLLVWGGDGTAHEAINGMMRIKAELGEGSGPPKSVGFLRGGTGNGIQDSYKVPYRISRQMANYSAAARKGYALDVDLISVRSGDFQAWCQLAGVGLDAKVLARRERRERTGPRMRVPAAGFFNYLAASLGAMFSREFEPEPFTVQMAQGKYAFSSPRVNAEFPFERITLDRAPTLLEAGTRTFYGKLFRICPDVVCNDGLMDLYFYNLSSLLTVGRYLPHLWMGRHGAVNIRTDREGRARIERFEVRQARIESSKRFKYHIDGELREAHEEEPNRYVVELTVEPLALRFLVPPGFYRLFNPPQGVTVAVQ